MAAIPRFLGGDSVVLEDIEQVLPVAKHSLPALAGALEGRCEIALGPYSAALDRTSKRLDK
eukprot:1330318-Alexandrium_andersonii.AAC.1